MGHRYVSNPFMTPGLHQHDNNHTPRIPMVVGTGNGPFIGPMDMARGGVHSDPHWNSGDRSYEYHSSNVTMEMHRHPPPLPRPPVDPYTYSSINGNTYNVTNTHNIDGGVQNPTPGIGGGGGYKRKSPCIYETRNLYGASGSSSSLPHPYRDRGGTSHSVVGEDSMRNVRSRTNCLFPSHYHQTTTNYPAPVHPVNVNADVTNREWNPVPHYAVSSQGRTPLPDINGPRQIYGGGSGVDVDPYSSGNHVPLTQYPHVPHAQSMGYGSSYYSQRVTPSYRNDPYYPHAGSWSTTEPENFASRYSSHHTSGGGYRSTRPRASVERLHPIHHIMDSHYRPQHQSLMVDQPSFSRNFSDQYQDMRLDIDTMTYEELLALEERIGDVSTGLSEDTMSRCLRERVYYSLHRNDEEATCPICLEEYKKGEKVGKMEKCGHEYHSDCIKKWLMMKKLCPICKCEC